MEVDVADWSTKDAYGFITSAVAPRPIAWVTTLNEDGSVNAAPFSWFQSVCADPPMVMVVFGRHKGGREKDTARNIKRSGEFVVNGATKDVLDALVASSAPYDHGVSEVAKLQLQTTPGSAVAPPRLAAAHWHLECKFVEAHDYGLDGGDPTTMIIGEIVHIHADDDVLDENGRIRPEVGHLARLGGKDYLAVSKTFEVERPSVKESS